MATKAPAHSEERLKAEAIAGRFIFEHSYQPPQTCVHDMGDWQPWSTAEACEDVPGQWRECHSCGLVEGRVA